jgi:glutamate carboxypeptidase
MRDFVDRNLRHHFQQRLDPSLALLKTLVEFESFSSDKLAVDTLGAFVNERLVGLGLQSVVHSHPERGCCISASWRGQGNAGPVMILSHLDTVWPAGTVAARPFRIEGGRAYGPGVYDMKSGILLSLLVAEALAEGRIEAAGEVRFFYSSDEEIGTDASLSRLQESARGCRAVFCLEPSLAGGEAKTFRKGVGNFKLQVRGIASHAGVAPEKGANAIIELSRLLLELHKMSDAARGITISPGLIQGGVAVNVIPDNAFAEVDFRFVSPADGTRVETRVRELRPFETRCALVIEGGINRPPLERTKAVAGLYRAAQKVAADLGETLGEGASGGGSDGSFTAHWGIPTLDGLGVRGSGAHACDEQIEVSDIPFRAALLAGLVCLPGQWNEEDSP